MVTFFVSAIWHGFYPGFFNFFLGAGIMDVVSKRSGEVLAPLIGDKIPGALQYLAAWIFCYVFCAYFAASFILLSFEKFHKLYASMYYLGHIILFVLLLFTIVAGKPAKSQANKEQEKKGKTIKIN